MKTTVVITGITGCIGTVLSSGLNNRWQIKGVARHPSDDVPVTVMDICDTGSLTEVFRGARAVIHLAANPSVGASWDEVLHSNIRGTESVFEAARQAGVKKVIFASSNHVTGVYEQEEPYRSIVTGRYAEVEHGTIPQIDHTSPIKPDSYYGVSKAFGEALGRLYAERYSMQVICLRIGTVNRENRPHDVRQFATLFRHQDLVTMVEKCLENDTLGYAILYGVSNNYWRFWDLSHVERCLGWVPEENAETLR